MRFSIFFIIFCLTLNSHAQNTLDFGEVRADKNFKCPDRAHWDSLMLGIGNICDSKNDLEIRFVTKYMPIDGNNLILITFANGKWAAKKFFTKQGGLVGNKTDCTTILQDPYAKQIYDSVFTAFYSTLKQNNIFSLPNMNEVRKTIVVSDGVSYELTFKAKDKFRTYLFDNPKEYQKIYPDVIQYREYTAIVEALIGLFVDPKNGYHPPYLK